MRAVIRLPKRRVATITMTPSATPEMMRLRRGKVPGEGGALGGGKCVEIQGAKRFRHNFVFVNQGAAGYFSRVRSKHQFNAQALNQPEQWLGDIRQHERPREQPNFLLNALLVRAQ